MKKTALITGASSGIGMATARAFALHGFRLILCGRREERLKDLQKELSAQTEVHILIFDVSHRAVGEAAISSLPKEFSQVDILVHDAGNAHRLSPID